MAKRDEIYRSKSKYLKAADLQGPITVTIERAPTETLKNNGEEEQKTVLYFKGKQKCFPLNLTNWDSVAEITGEDDTDAWPGHEIQLFPTTTEMKGKTVPCIRISTPAQGELKPQKTTAKAKPKRAPGDNSDLDDAIPF